MTAPTTTTKHPKLPLYERLTRLAVVREGRWTREENGR